eukprot:jgi/Mesvir1/11985/Mv25018-RA.2
MAATMPSLRQMDSSPRGYGVLDSDKSCQMPSKEESAKPASSRAPPRGPGLPRHSVGTRSYPATFLGLSLQIPNPPTRDPLSPTHDAAPPTPQPPVVAGETKAPVSAWKGVRPSIPLGSSKLPPAGPSQNLYSPVSTTSYNPAFGTSGVSMSPVLLDHQKFDMSPTTGSVVSFKHWSASPWGEGAAQPVIGSKDSAFEKSPMLRGSNSNNNSHHNAHNSNNNNSNGSSSGHHGNGTNHAATASANMNAEAGHANGAEGSTRQGGAATAAPKGADRGTLGEVAMAPSDADAGGRPTGGPTSGDDKNAINNGGADRGAGDGGEDGPVTNLPTRNSFTKFSASTRTPPGKKRRHPGWDDIVMDEDGERPRRTSHDAAADACHEAPTDSPAISFSRHHESLATDSPAVSFGLWAQQARAREKSGLHRTESGRVTDQAGAGHAAAVNGSTASGGGNGLGANRGDSVDLATCATSGDKGGGAAPGGGVVGPNVTMGPTACSKPPRGAGCGDGPAGNGTGGGSSAPTAAYLAGHDIPPLPPPSTSRASRRSNDECSSGGGHGSLPSSPGSAPWFAGGLSPVNTPTGPAGGGGGGGGFDDAWAPGSLRDAVRYDWVAFGFKSSHGKQSTYFRCTAAGCRARMREEKLETAVAGLGAGSVLCAFRREHTHLPPVRTVGGGASQVSLEASGKAGKEGAAAAGGREGGNAAVGGGRGSSSSANARWDAAQERRRMQQQQLAQSHHPHSAGGRDNNDDASDISSDGFDSDGDGDEGAVTGDPSRRGAHVPVLRAMGQGKDQGRGDPSAGGPWEKDRDRERERGGSQGAMGAPSPRSAMGGNNNNSSSGGKAATRSRYMDVVLNADCPSPSSPGPAKEWPQPAGPPSHVVPPSALVPVGGPPGSALGMGGGEMGPLYGGAPRPVGLPQEPLQDTAAANGGGARYGVAPARYDAYGRPAPSVVGGAGPAPMDAQGWMKPGAGVPPTSIAGSLMAPASSWLAANSSAAGGVAPGLGPAGFYKLASAPIVRPSSNLVSGMELPPPQAPSQPSHHHHQLQQQAFQQQQQQQQQHGPGSALSWPPSPHDSAYGGSDGYDWRAARQDMHAFSRAMPGVLISPQAPTDGFFRGFGKSSSAGPTAAPSPTEPPPPPSQLPSGGYGGSSGAADAAAIMTAAAAAAAAARMSANAAGGAGLRAGDPGPMDGSRSPGPSMGYRSPMGDSPYSGWWADQGGVPMGGVDPWGAALAQQQQQQAQQQHRTQQLQQQQVASPTVEAARRVLQGAAQAHPGMQARPALWGDMAAAAAGGMSPPTAPSTAYSQQQQQQQQHQQQQQAPQAAALTQALAGSGLWNVPLQLVQQQLVQQLLMHGAGGYGGQLSALQIQQLLAQQHTMRGMGAPGVAGAATQGVAGGVPPAMHPFLMGGGGGGAPGMERRAGGAAEPMGPEHVHRLGKPPGGPSAGGQELELSLESPSGNDASWRTMESEGGGAAMGPDRRMGVDGGGGGLTGRGYPHGGEGAFPHNG